MILLAQYTAPISNLGRSHMALGKKVAAQAVGLSWSRVPAYNVT